MTYCETVNFAKHLGIRTTTWGGFIELGLTILMAFVKNWAQKGESPLYNAFDGAFISYTTCAQTSRAFGEMLHYMMSVDIQTEIFFEDLTYSLAELDSENSSITAA